MLYSRWLPTGGYEVYEATDVMPLGDDVPVPRLPSAVKLGVPSIEAGNPLPFGARLVGRSAVPKGIVAPMAKPNPSAKASVLASFGPTNAPEQGIVGPVLGFGLGAALVGAIWMAKSGRF